MPGDKELRSILILGAGPIVIGPANEFDHSGTPACCFLEGGITAERVCTIGVVRPNVGDSISNEEMFGLATGAVEPARLKLGRTKCTDEDFGHIEFVTLSYQLTD